MSSKAATAFAAVVFSSSRRSQPGGFQTRPNPGLGSESIQARLAARKAAQDAMQRRAAEGAIAK